MQLGFIGLGKMGSRMVKKLLDDGHNVIVWNRSPEPVQELKSQISNLKSAETIKDLVQSLGKPRVIWIMVPAKDATSEVLSEVSKYIEKKDIVIDGGNAFYKDTERRYKKLRNKDIKFLGIGVSGGVHGEKNGYSLMAGGDRSAYDSIVQLLDCLSKPSGSFDYFGEGGAGHFVKMVHNGIEYGMMQSIGEGFAVLKKSSYKFDLLKIAKIWQRGTIISGFLIDRTKDALEADVKLSGISGNIKRGGEGDWTVEAAKEEKVAVEIIKESVKFRKKSETDSRIQNSYTAKMINALRHQFGGHPVRLAQGKEAKKGS